MATIVTKSAAKARRYVNAAKSMPHLKRAAHKAHRSRVKRELKRMTVGWHPLDECDVEPVRRSEMVTAWEVD